MEIGIGIAVALAVCLFATASGMDKERSFYSTVLCIVASYYVLFAAMAGSSTALLRELIPLGLFLAIAVLGFKRSVWFLVAGLAGHGLFDFVHSTILTNPGVPTWWPGFCLAFDVAAGAYLGFRLATKPRNVT